MKNILLGLAILFQPLLLTAQAPPIVLGPNVRSGPAVIIESPTYPALTNRTGTVKTTSDEGDPVVYNKVDADRTFIRSVDLLANALALDPNLISANISIAGRTVAGDGFGGVFYVDLTSGATPDDGTVFAFTHASAPAAARLIRIRNTNVYKPEWFGASLVYDSGVDDTAFVQAALDASVTDAFAADGGSMLLSRMYRVVPSSGYVDWTDKASPLSQSRAPSGYIAAGFDYEVWGTAGTINYRGTNYSIGTIVEGVFDYVGYAKQTEIEEATLNTAGSGYTASDVLTLDLSGGTGTPATITVDTVGGSGEISTFTLTTAGDYTTPSTTETAVGVTGGTGTLATFNITQYAHSTYDAVLIPKFDVAVWTTNNTVSIRGMGWSTGLFLDGEGVALGLLGSGPGTDPGDPIGVTLKDFTINGDPDGDLVGNNEGTVGLFASFATFFGQFDLNCQQTSIGVIFNGCWNSHIQSLNLGGPSMDWGMQGWNANQFDIDHFATQNGRFGAEVNTTTAHSATVGETVVFRENNAWEFTGPVVEIVDSDTIKVWPLSSTTSNTLSNNTVVVDYTGTPTTNVLEMVTIKGGIGMAVNSLEGFTVNGSWQNQGESAIRLYSNDVPGGLGPVRIFGNVEGPSNMLTAMREPFDTRGHLEGLKLQLTGFTGARRNAVGERHGIILDHVWKSDLDISRVQARPGTGATNNLALWIKDTCKDIEVGNMSFDHTDNTKKLLDDQPWPARVPGYPVMFSVAGPVLSSASNFTGNSSAISVTPLRYVRTQNEVNDDNESRRVRYAIVKIKFTIDTVGAAGTRIAAKLTGTDINTNNEQFPIYVAAGASHVGMIHEAVATFPVSQSTGQFKIQWFLDSGWQADIECRQIGAIY